MSGCERSPYINKRIKKTGIRTAVLSLARGAILFAAACRVVRWSLRRWSRHRQIHEERRGPWAGESTTPRELSTTGECKAPPERHRRGEGGTQALITRHHYTTAH